MLVASIWNSQACYQFLSFHNTKGNDLLQLFHNKSEILKKNVFSGMKIIIMQLFYLQTLKAH